MGNTFAWPMIRLIQSVSMVLTLACSAYVIFFLCCKDKENPLAENSGIISTNNIGLISPLPVFDLKSYDRAANPQARDIFSISASDNLSGAVENTPKGQLPDHLKIVGILIAHPSQIIIEDKLAKKTYFIDEENPQAGIKIARVYKNLMILNYQGQDISVPIHKK